ncbi:DoxX family protein [Nocardia sp. NPDC052112]|uniref:DoxX family protein n=1 Tax=Nocardia sp. NPDC052112 TaxID=3155646 RepID=UPI0034376F2F
MYIAVVILAILLALAYFAAGISKAIGAEQAMATADHLRVPHAQYRVIGALEILGAAGVLAGIVWGWLGVAAGSGLLALMLGALVTHARAKDPVKAMVPALILGLIAAAFIATRVLTL